MTETISTFVLKILIVDDILIFSFGLDRKISRVMRCRVPLLLLLLLLRLLSKSS